MNFINVTKEIMIISNKLVSGLMSITSFRDEVEEVIREHTWKMNNNQN